MPVTSQSSFNLSSAIRLSLSIILSDQLSFGYFLPFPQSFSTFRSSVISQSFSTLFFVSHPSGTLYHFDSHPSIILYLYLFVSHPQPFRQSFVSFPLTFTLISHPSTQSVCLPIRQSQFGHPLLCRPSSISL